MQIIESQACGVQPPDIVYDLVNLPAILRHCRLTVCEAYVSGRHPAALAALAAASIRLCRYIDNGSLIGSIACAELWEIADNLTLTKVFGEEVVGEATATGPQFDDRVSHEQ